jgi:hypothetical protein
MLLRIRRKVAVYIDVEIEKKGTLSEMRTQHERSRWTAEANDKAEANLCTCRATNESNMRRDRAKSWNEDRSNPEKIVVSRSGPSGLLFYSRVFG